MNRKFLTVCALSAFVIAPVSVLARAKATAPLPVRLPADGCWKYTGRADGFVVHVRSGDRLVITAAGEADFMDGRTRWSTVEKRDVMVSRRGDQTSALQPSAGNVYRFDKDGDYSFSLWPGAIHGLPGMVIVCRARPEKGA